MPKFVIERVPAPWAVPCSSDSATFNGSNVPPGSRALRIAKPRPTRTTPTIRDSPERR
jgi:hypothetical protein